jgi:hypothetical protein
MFALCARQGLPLRARLGVNTVIGDGLHRLKSSATVYEVRPKSSAELCRECEVFPAELSFL